MRTAYDVIIRPIITEQSMEDQDIKKYALQLQKMPIRSRSQRLLRKFSVSPLSK